MKITFEGSDRQKLYEEMQHFLWDIREDYPRAPEPQAAAPAPAPPVQKSKGGRPKGFKVKPKAKPVEKTVEKIVEKAAEKAAKKPEPTDLAVVPKGAKGVPSSAMQDEKVMQTEKFEDMVLEPDPMEEPVSPVIDVAKLTALRIKTTEDLQAAYSNGKHKQVLELLSTYGNGAKSFRELAIKDFIPIRKAIDDGALQ